MKANELMVGDWLKHANGKYYRVTRIDVLGDYNSIHYACGFPHLWEYNNKFEPIPLTPDILKKNGFEVTRNITSSGNKDVWSLRVSKNKVFHITEHHNKRQFPYFWIELGSNSDIKYVHQLQHALGLCGIEKEIEL